MEKPEYIHKLTIKVKGHPDIFWDEWFEHAIIKNNEDGATDITLFVTDQSALMGILISLHNLGLEIICLQDCQQGSSAKGVL
jgi:hypothetical protein